MDGDDVPSGRLRPHSHGGAVRAVAMSADAPESTLRGFDRAYGSAGCYRLGVRDPVGRPDALVDHILE